MVIFIVSHNTYGHLRMTCTDWSNEKKARATQDRDGTVEGTTKGTYTYKSRTRGPEAEIIEASWEDEAEAEQEEVDALAEIYTYVFYLSKQAYPCKISTYVSNVYDM